ncbi:hypothetical protein D7Y15_08100 [Corallococcus sp. AB030]|nr:hypothetical protein D7Y15_08100 [Corallococcus sp. AB030]
MLEEKLALMGQVHPAIAAAINAGLIADPPLHQQVDQDPSKWEFVYTLGEETDDATGSSVPFVVYAQPTGPLQRPGSGE